jgi:hypothetical protein
MKSQILISAVSISIFVLTTGVWAAESCAAEKLDLKLRLKAGQKYSMRITTEQKISQTIGGKQQDISHMKATGMSFEVKEVDANDVASIKVTYRTLQQKATSTAGEFEYNSTDPCTAVNNPLAPTYAALMGDGFIMKVTPEGEIVGLDGIDEMFMRMAEKIVVAEDKLISAAPAGTCEPAKEKAVKETPEERASRRIEATNNIYGSRDKRKQALKEMIKNNPLFAEKQFKNLARNIVTAFPNQSVGIGDSWGGKITLSAVLPVEVNSTYTLKGNEKGVVVVDVSSKMGLDEKAIGNKKGLPGQTDMKMRGSSSYQGTLQIDGTSGWMIRKKANMRFSGEVTQQGMTVPISIESVIAVEPIERVVGF